MMRAMRLRLALSLAALLAAAACGDDGDDAEAARRSASGGDRPSSRADAPVFGTDGQLLESDTVVAGLRVPRGLETVLDEERSHVYHSRVPLRKLQAYFGERLITGEVDRMGDGAIYRGAVPRGVTGGVVRMDVSILPMSRDRARVEIVELPPTPTNPLTEQQYNEALERDLRRWE